MGSEKTVRLSKQKAPVAAASSASRVPSKPQRLKNPKLKIEKGEQSKREHRLRRDSDTDASEDRVFKTDSEGDTSAESSSSYSSSDAEEGRRQKKSWYGSNSSSSESSDSDSDSESASDSDDTDMGSSRRRRRHIQRH